MAIKFGSDGTLYCNTVRYNYKQARNIVYNNCGVLGTKGWTASSNWVGAMQSSGATRFHRCFEFPLYKNTQSSLKQTMAIEPIANHKYYGSIMYCTKSDTTDTTVLRTKYSGFRWVTLNGIGAELQFTDCNTTTNNNWVKLSSIVTADASITENQSWLAILCFYPTSIDFSYEYRYISDVILIDLTETFGSGNEPSQAWCDANILESNKFIGYDSDEINIGSSIQLYYCTKYDYHDANSLKQPGFLTCPLYDIKTNDAQIYGMLRRSAVTYDTSKYYYISADILTQSNTMPPHNSYWYLLVPSSNTAKGYPFGKVKGFSHDILTNSKTVTKGMTAWRRESFFGKPTSSESCYLELRFVNENRIYYFWFANWTIIDVSDLFNSEYQTLFGEKSVSIEDLNKEWCDRWLEGEGSSIIHIKDPSKTYIKFKKPLTQLNPTTSLEFTTTELTELLTTTYSTAVTNNLESLAVGEYVYYTIKDTTTNKIVRYLCYIKSKETETNTVSTYMTGFGYECTTTTAERPSEATNAVWQFCEGYDIECNDIEIHPEIDYISFDKTGTIKCKKLVTNF